MFLFPYQDKDSRIHRMDARPKMVFVLSMFLLSILISDTVYLLALFGLVMTVAAAGKVLRPTLGLLKYTVYVAAFLFLFSILFSQGSTVLFEIGPIEVKEESVLFASSMCARLFLAIASFAILTFTVHPDEMMRTLSKFGYKTITGLSIATKMYPTIAMDSKNIEDAMKARGVEFDSGNILVKAKARAPIMMPLMLNSMDRAIEVAEAMEARGFGAGVRTRYHDRPLSKKDKVMIASFLAALPFGIAMFILGFGNADYINGAPLSICIDDILVIMVEIALFLPIFAGGRR
ncbi:MAG: energy-coupling factor transporter transmembrane protein EcfT [Methanomassiliicoccales archaeon]|nr:MAG: energy-coupling factor transporter transmembrane protein EcfT [Methanomassiliicoccales archaeon]